MSECMKCEKSIYGDDLYEVEGKVYCEDCAKILTKPSNSISPTGFGCKGAYLTQDHKEKE